MSIRRLLRSYTLAAIATHAAVAAALFAFPMTGRAETIPTSSDQQQPLPESIDVSELPEVLQNPIWEKVRAFMGTPFTTNLMPKIENAVNGLDSHFIRTWSTVPDGNHDSRVLVEFDNAVARSTPSEANSTSATEKVRSQTQSTVYRVSEGHLEVGRRFTSPIRIPQPLHRFRSLSC